MPQDPALAAADRLLNSYLRSTSKDNLKDATELVAELLAGGLAKKGMSANDAINLVRENPALQDFLAYVIRYALDNPDDRNDIFDFVDRFFPGLPRDTLNTILDFVTEHPNLVSVGSDILANILRVFLDDENDEYVDLIHDLIKQILKREVKDEGWDQKIGKPNYYKKDQLQIDTS